MFFGTTIAKVYRSDGHDRDGDEVFEHHHDIVGCNWQPSSLQSWPEADKSDGGVSEYAVKTNSALYCRPNEDIQVGDRIEVGGGMHRVVGPPLVHTFPSGVQPGMKVHLTNVERW